MTCMRCSENFSAICSLTTKICSLTSILWNWLVEQGEFTDDENLNRLFFISMLRPEAFSDAILLGANVARQFGLSLAHSVSWLSIR